MILMFNRLELKYKAKQLLHLNLFQFVLSAVVLYFISLSFIAYQINLETEQITLFVFNQAIWSGLGDEALFLLQKVSLALIVYSILIQYSFDYGLRNAYKNACLTHFDWKTVFSGFSKGYSKIMATYVIRDIYIFFWSMLFIIPGIMKAYSYRFVPYLLKDYPDMTTSEILRFSTELTMGFRWQILMMDISFIGWTVINTLTYGLTGLYSHPYVRLADAQLYLTLKDRHSLGTE